MDELVKRLREVADEVDSDYDVDPYNAEQRCLAILQAADAIEASSKLALDEHNRAAKLAWESRWIPVTERLPEAGDHVLVYAGFFQPFNEVSYIDAEGKWRFAYDDTEVPIVTHWMELPEPPKEE